MPQVDLETLVSACAGGSSDRKIACETLATMDNPPQKTDTADLHEIPPDFPPESFWLSKDAELDWLNHNAFYERKDSTKGNSNSTNLNPNINPNSNSSNSQRFSNFHTKASIIGLPKTQKSTFVIDTKNRRNCKTGNTRLFPKRSSSTGKSDSTAMIEPSSPKVSCMGRVRSKRDRNRRLRKKQQQQQQKQQRSAQSIEKKENARKDNHEKKPKIGFFASFKAIFRSSRSKDISRGNSTSLGGGSASESHAFKKSSDIRDRLPPSERDAPPRRSVDSASGLGGMARFTSGRRSESWSMEIDVA